jgi:acyl-homoserine lactone synthase
MRVHVVSQHNRSLYLHEIEAMHRHRHDLFVGQLGWRDLASPDGLDVDEFDTQDATYLIAIDDEGRMMGSGRLMPSWRRHMLKDLFPHFCSEPVPVGPDIWEWTRHAPPGRAYPRETNLAVNLALNIAVVEFAGARGIVGITGLLEARMVPYALSIGWRNRPLGAPKSYAEGTAVALLNELWTGQLDAFRTLAGRSDPYLVECHAQSDRAQLRDRRVNLDLAA